MTQYLSLDGSSGNRVQTPWQAAFDPGAGVNLAVAALVRTARDDDQNIILGFRSSVGAMIMQFRLQGQFSQAAVDLEQSDGTHSVAVSSADPYSVIDTVSRWWIGFEVDIDNGSGGTDVLFYTGGKLSIPSWSQLGATQSIAGTTGDWSLETPPLAFGDRSDGTSIALEGDLVEGILIEGDLSGTELAHFDANDFSVGDGDTDTAVSSHTGETWTIHGANAKIVDDGVVSGGNPLLLLGVG